MNFWILLSSNLWIVMATEVGLWACVLKVLFMIFTRQWTTLWREILVWFLMLDVHCNLYKKTFTYEGVLCDLYIINYMWLYILGTFWCIISLYIYQWNLGWVLFEVNSSMNKTFRSWYILTFLNIFLAASRLLWVSLSPCYYHGLDYQKKKYLTYLTVSSIFPSLPRGPFEFQVRVVIVILAAPLILLSLLSWSQLPEKVSKA